MNRYGFNVKTRSGQRVENIVIMAASRGDAERRLMQMYVQCEILECREQAVRSGRGQLQRGGEFGERRAVFGGG